MIRARENAANLIQIPDETHSNMMMCCSVVDGRNIYIGITIIDPFCSELPPTPTYISRGQKLFCFKIGLRKNCHFKMIVPFEKCSAASKIFC